MSKRIPPAVLKTWQSYFGALDDTQSRIICRLIQVILSIEGTEYQLPASVTPEDYAKIEVLLEGKESGKQ